MAAPGSPDVEMIKRPKVVKAFEGQLLRDLTLSETYGGTFPHLRTTFFTLAHPLPFSIAAVDEKGDVLQWGLGFDPSPSGASPRKTLQHQDIVKLSATKNKLYALNRSGEVFVVPAELEKQRLGAEARRESGWWAVWQSKDPGTDVEKLRTDSTLSRGEK